MFFWGCFLPVRCEHWTLQGLLLGGLWPTCLWEPVSLPLALGLSLSSPACAWANIHLSCAGSLWPACISSLPAHFPHCLGCILLGISVLWLVIQPLCKRRLKKIEKSPVSSHGTQRQGCCHSWLFSLSLALPAPQGLALPQDGFLGKQVLAGPLGVLEAQVSCASFSLAWESVTAPWFWPWTLPLASAAAFPPSLCFSPRSLPRNGCLLGL